MNRKHVVNLSLFFAVILILSGCGQSSSQPSTNESKQADSAIAKEQPKDSSTLVREKLNDIALFVSGLPVNKNSSIYELTQTPEWSEYSEEAKNAWARFDSLTAKYSAFSKAEIKSPYDSIKTLFYPFSRPIFYLPISCFQM